MHQGIQSMEHHRYHSKSVNLQKGRIIVEESNRPADKEEIDSRDDTPDSDTGTLKQLQRKRSSRKRWNAKASE
jgi:hypothetical protein